MFNQDYKDLLKIFNAFGVDYMIIGAYAMAAHGIVRSTGDMDIFVRPDINNAKKVYAALAKFGAPLQNIEPDDFSSPGTVYQIGVVPCRIDILNSIDGISYDEADKVFKKVDDMDVPFIDLESLKINKKSTGRSKDLIDLDLLK